MVVDPVVTEEEDNRGAKRAGVAGKDRPLSCFRIDLSGCGAADDDEGVVVPDTGAEVEASATLSVETELGLV